MRWIQVIWVPFGAGISLKIKTLLDKDGIIFRLKTPNKDDYDTIDNIEYEKWRDCVLDEETKKDMPITNRNVKGAFER